MSGEDHSTAVGPLPEPAGTLPTRIPVVVTRLVWLLWLGSLGVVIARFLGEGPWEVAGLVVVDGLTIVMWPVVTFLSGIVHSYSRRYMAGSRDIARFFTTTFGFTLAVMVLVVADHVVLFGGAWLAMGLLMADLIGYVRGWPQAQAAAGLARRYFIVSSLFLTLALGTLWWTTGETAVSGLATAGDVVGTPIVWVAGGSLLLAAMIQSALVPFHGWLLGSMTAPTPASALMHAGFVNAGGILLTRFAALLTVDAFVMLSIVLVGATSALLGKLLKTVQADVKGQLGCSTVGQMGFMIMQAGLGFFGAAITHLVLHGFYKAYQFLGSGEGVEHTSPASYGARPATFNPAGIAVALLTGIAGGAVFAGLTGKGTGIDSGLVLTVLVVVLTLHASYDLLRRQSLPTPVRYLAVPLVALPAIALYAIVYTTITGLMADLPVVTAPAELTLVHGIVAAIFLVAYVAIETGVYRRSHRLYVVLVNASQPAVGTLLTASEEYNEY